jgi:hypothetical protein
MVGVVVKGGWGGMEWIGDKEYIHTERDVCIVYTQMSTPSRQRTHTHHTHTHTHIYTTTPTAHLDAPALHLLVAHTGGAVLLYASAEVRDTRVVCVCGGGVCVFCFECARACVLHVYVCVRSMNAYAPTRLCYLVSLYTYAIQPTNQPTNQLTNKTGPRAAVRRQQSPLPAATTPHTRPT